MPESTLAPDSPAERRVVAPAMVKADKTALRPHRPFTANVPRDPVRGLSPHEGAAKEPRRIESPALPLRGGAPIAEPASSGSKYPGARLRAWPTPTAHALDVPASTERTSDSGAAAQECHVARQTIPTCCNRLDRSEKPDAFSLSEGDLCFWFSFVRPTLQMSRAPSAT